MRRANEGVFFFWLPQPSAFKSVYNSINFTQTDFKSGAVVAEIEPQTYFLNASQIIKDICLKFVKNYLESTLFV